MSKVFNLKIIDPDKTIYDSTALSLIAPAVSGYLGVLANHAPLFAGLKKGIIFVRDGSGKSLSFATPCQGFLEVLNNNVNLVFDQPIPASLKK